MGEPAPTHSPDYAAKAKAIEDVMRVAAARIREMGGDSVVILVTLEDTLDGKTGCLHVGMGNMYARRGSLEVGQGFYTIEYTSSPHAQDESDHDD